MKKNLKSTIAATLHGSGLLGAFQSMKYSRSQFGDAVILMYHRVVDDLGDALAHTQPGMMVTRATFEGQLELLSKAYKVISLSELVDSMRDGKKPDPRSVVLTFDDGWLDNYTHAYPLLKKHGVPATIFLTTDYIGSRGTFWFHKIGLALSAHQLSGREIRAVIHARCADTGETVPSFLNGPIESGDGIVAADRLLESLKPLSGASLDRISDILLDRLPDRPPQIDERWMLNWDEVNTMAGDLVEFGSHGCSHQIAITLKPEKWEQELRDSRAAITNQIGTQIELLAYPNGNFNKEVADMVQKVGYKGAVTTAYTASGEAVDPMFALRRVGVHEGMSVDSSGRFSPSLFAFGISGWKDRLQGNL